MIEWGGRISLNLGLFIYLFTFTTFHFEVLSQNGHYTAMKTEYNLKL